MIDYITLPVEWRAVGGWFINDVVWWVNPNSANYWVLPEQADSALGMLGLLNMRVKCVLAEGLGDDYAAPEVSGACDESASQMWS